jgi:hypothetical protein
MKRSSGDDDGLKTKTMKKQQIKKPQADELKKAPVTETIEFSAKPNDAVSDQVEIAASEQPKDTVWERLKMRCDMSVFAKWSLYVFLLLSPGLNDVIWNDVNRPFDAFLFITGNGYIGDPVAVYVIGNIVVWLMLIFAVVYLMLQYLLNERDQVSTMIDCCD